MPAVMSDVIWMMKTVKKIIAIFQDNIGHELPPNFSISANNSIDSLSICSMSAAGILLDIEDAFDADISVLPDWCTGKITIHQIALYLYSLQMINGNKSIPVV